MGTYCSILFLDLYADCDDDDPFVLSPYRLIVKDKWRSLSFFNLLHC